MSRPFKNSSSANNAFGQFKEPKDASEYLHNKKARATYCVANSCQPSIKVSSQQNKLLFNKSNQLSLYPCRGTINPANLNINLITRLNLNGVSVIKDLSNNAVPSTINVNAIPFLRYEIDPNGSLFGNSICGIENFKRYLRPELTLPPYIIIDGNYLLSSDSSYNTIIKFTTDSTMRILEQILMNYIVVGGGGGGGSGYIGSNGGGGGGGGGGIIQNSTLFNVSSYTIAVGTGGNGASYLTPGQPGSNGNSSSINGNLVNIVANGGFAGITNGGASGTPGSTGGTGNGSPGGNGTLGGGGGSAGYTQSGGNGSVNISTIIYGTLFGAGGGGGGGGSGSSTGGIGGNSNAGNGGNRISITNAGNGVSNTGGGGGGGSEGNNGNSFVGGGNGGSGVVVLAFNA